MAVSINIGTSRYGRADLRVSQPGGAAAPPGHFDAPSGRPGASGKRLQVLSFLLLNFPEFCRTVFPRLSSPIP
jgi:hypothetical protein